MAGARESESQWQVHSGIEAAEEDSETMRVQQQVPFGPHDRGSAPASRVLKEGAEWMDILSSRTFSSSFSSFSGSVGRFSIDGLEEINCLALPCSCSCSETGL